MIFNKVRFTKILAILFLVIGAQFSFIKELKYKSGDLIFLSNPIHPDKLLQAITKTKFSHVGIVVKEKGKLSVYYAGATVKSLSIPAFLALSVNGKFEVMRYKDTLLLSGLNEAFIFESKKLLGSPYDFKYSWLDKEIYNTELVWKIYKRAANIELCANRPLASLSINDTLIAKKIKREIGDTISPYTKIVSATDLYNSEFLVKVK